MSEIAAFQAALASLKTATDLVKILKQSTVSLKDAEVNFKLAELLGALADAKTDLAQIQGTIEEQQRAIRELEAQLAKRRAMEFEAPYYWSVEGDKKEGPFCQPCWDEKKIESRLYSRQTGRWTCLVCQKVVYDKNYQPPPPALRRTGSWMGR